MIRNEKLCARYIQTTLLQSVNVLTPQSLWSELVDTLHVTVVEEDVEQTIVAIIGSW